jgi:RNA polymerase sigma factor (sigma-70 family)
MMTDDAAQQLVSLYRCDLAQVPPLSEQEQQHLLEAVRVHRDTAARNRLIEHYLGPATWLTIKACPAACLPLLPDIIGELNLQIVQAADRLTSVDHPHAYLSSLAKSAIKNAVHKSRMIRIPRTTYDSAVERGEAERFAALETSSLDCIRQEDKHSRRGIPMRPPFSTEAAPPRNPALQQQIEDWLTHLPARDEGIVRMYYGLQAGDERCYSLPEIAQVFQMTTQAVRGALKSAHLRLQKLAEGTAEFREHEGRMIVKDMLCSFGRARVLTDEQEQELMQIAQELYRRGEAISVRKLKKLSRWSEARATLFWQQHQHEFPPAYRAGTPECRQRLEAERAEQIRQVYEQWCRQGKPISVAGIAKTLHMNVAHVQPLVQQWEAAREQAEPQHRPVSPAVAARKARAEQQRRAREERLRQVYEQWRAQGKPITAWQLYKETRINHYAIQAFLRECEAGEH